MPAKEYDWKDGPAIIQPHSMAKHNVLRFYLEDYFKTLVNDPKRDELRLTLVDGFAGGGLYVSGDNKNLIEGSPFILLNTAREAEFFINKDRKKPIKFNIDYFFVELNYHAHSHLYKTLQERGYGEQIGKTIRIVKSKFQDQAIHIIDHIKKKTPKSGRSIFILDQYGYKDVPTSIIKNIFKRLPTAEIILTFGVDSLLNFANDEKIQGLNKIGIPTFLKGKTFDEIKQSNPKEWRLFIQSQLYPTLVTSCGARYYTVFFIRNDKGHGDYWLIHLSQHPRARDVMTEVHWKNQNHFIHYGGPGLDMFQILGYNPSKLKGQSVLGFEFDYTAHQASIKTLNEQIPNLIYASNRGISFEELFITTCNNSPASSTIYRESLAYLMEQKVIEIITTDGGRRISAKQIKLDDRILAPKQRPLILL